MINKRVIVCHYRRAEFSDPTGASNIIDENKCLNKIPEKELPNYEQYAVNDDKDEVYYCDKTNADYDLILIIFRGGIASEKERFINNLLILSRFGDYNGRYIAMLIHPDGSHENPNILEALEDKLKTNGFNNIYMRDWPKANAPEGIRTQIIDIVKFAGTDNALPWDKIEELCSRFRIDGEILKKKLKEHIYSLAALHFAIQAFWGVSIENDDILVKYGRREERSNPLISKIRETCSSLKDVSDELNSEYAALFPNPEVFDSITRALDLKGLIELLDIYAKNIDNYCELRHVIEGIIGYPNYLINTVMDEGKPDKVREILVLIDEAVSKLIDQYQN